MFLLILTAVQLIVKLHERENSNKILRIHNITTKLNKKLHLQPFSTHLNFK